MEWRGEWSAWIWQIFFEAEQKGCSVNELRFELVKLLQQQITTATDTQQKMISLLFSFHFFFVWLLSSSLLLLLDSFRLLYCFGHLWMRVYTYIYMVRWSCTIKNVFVCCVYVCECVCEALFFYFSQAWKYFLSRLWNIQQFRRFFHFLLLLLQRTIKLFDSLADLVFHLLQSTTRSQSLYSRHVYANVETILASEWMLLPVQSVHTHTQI